MIFSNVALYFWSGTGNSYQVACWLAEQAAVKGVTAQVLALEQAALTDNTADNAGRLTGLVFPTHGFTAPWQVLRSTWRLPRGRAGRAFCVATRAGLKFGPLFIPGISGSAPFIVSLLLFLKGYRVRGAMSVDMPSNWFSLHPIQSRKKQEAIMLRARPRALGFLDQLLGGSSVWCTRNNFFEITWGILLSWISIAYLLIGRFFLAKLFFANEKCDGCGVCATHCPVHAIRMWGSKPSRPFWTYHCESCMRCASLCPRNAVEAGHSWGVALYYLTSVPVAAHLFSWLGGRLATEQNGLSLALQLVLYYPAVFLSYFLFHALLRFRIVNWLFTHTTMTHLPFWGRYHAPDVHLKTISSHPSDAGR
ncbi:MAG: NADH-plastoquinone oxidoreductase subunit [bacterium ADurb.Bin478]|nr:MAG: NADH-plastoquinone oxidoreductase subunit [bacterium ADurb.Bin478]